MEGRSGCIATTTRWSALFLALLVILLLPVTIVVHNFVSILFFPSLLTDVLVENLVYSGMVQREVATNLLAPELLGGEGAEGFEFAEAFRHLSEAERVELVEILAPPEWLEAQVREIVGGLSRWFWSDAPRPRITLDHRPIKESLASGGAERLVELIVDSWPSCSPQQAREMQNRDAQTGQVPILYCEPPEPTRTHISNYLVSQIELLAREMPVRVPLIAEDGESGDPEQSAQWKEQLRFLHAVGRSAWMIPFSFLGLIMAAAVRSWRDLTRWWGRVLLLAGILTIVAGVLMGAAAERFVLTGLSQLRAEARLAYDILIVALRSLSEAVLDSTAGHAILLILIGAVLLLVYWLLNRRAGSSGGSDDVHRMDDFVAVEDDVEGRGVAPPSVPPLNRDEPPSTASDEKEQRGGFR